MPKLIRTPKGDTYWISDDSAVGEGNVVIGTSPILDEDAQQAVTLPEPTGNQDASPVVETPANLSAFYKPAPAKDSLEPTQEPQIVEPQQSQFNPYPEPDVLPPPEDSVTQQFEIPRGYEDVAPQQAPPTPDAQPQAPQGIVPDQPQEQQPPAAPDFMSRLDQLTKGTRQMASGFGQATLSAPWELGKLAASTTLLPAPMNPMGALPASVREPIADYFGQQAEGARRGVANIFGVDQDPTNYTEAIPHAVGEALTPAGKQTALMSAIQLGGKLGGYGYDKLFGSAEAATAANPIGSTPSPDTQQVETVGGPTEVSDHDYRTFGYMVIATIGLAAAPFVYRKIKAGALPSFRKIGTMLDMTTGPRPVREAAPGTVDITKVRDYARTVNDDANKGAINAMERAGYSPQGAARVEEVMRIQTRATAEAMVDSAINTGEMRTPAFTFKSPVALSSLARRETPEAKQYMRALQTIEDIKQASLRLLNKNPQAGPPIIRGQSLLDASRVKAALEQTNPEVVQFAKDYAGILQSVRKYELTGEYATLHGSKYRYMNAQRKYNIRLKPYATGDAPIDEMAVTDELRLYMQKNMRDRLENEAKGLYVDEAKKSQTPNMFMEIDFDQAKANPPWMKNVVNFRRRGIMKAYTTAPLLADVLRMDPITLGNAGSIVYATKRMMEATTTGSFAPHFAVISFVRNMRTAMMSNMKGRRAPSIVGTAFAVPRQLVPQLEGYIGDVLNNAQGGWLGRVFGQQNVNLLAQRLTKAYTSSLWQRLNTTGGGRGSILQQQIAVYNRLSQLTKKSTGLTKTVLEGYEAILNSLHNASSFDYVVKNKGKAPLHQIASEARGLTGDPRVGGQYYTKHSQASNPEPIRFDLGEAKYKPGLAGVPKRIARGVSHTALAAAKGTGWLSENVGRTGLPWFNATMQSIKRVGQAYVNNPVGFMTKAWLYNAAPAAGAYLLALKAGKDPNGVSYVDYMMNRRSEYDQTMYDYIPIPGSPAEDGFTYPRFQEMAIISRMTLVAMDHLFRSPVFSRDEDIWAAVKGAAGVMFEPPIPPLISAGLGYFGVVAPQGPITGDAFTPRQDANTMYGTGLPRAVEMVTRALAPGFADIMGTGYAAFHQTPEGYAKAIGNFFEAAGKRTIQKTPILRDIVGERAPMSGNNRITEELFARNKVINELSDFFSKNDNLGGLVGARRSKAGVLEERVGRSKAGAELAQEVLGELLPSQSAGGDAKPPTNPLYQKFMQDVHDRFKKDVPYDSTGNPTGAVGYVSLFKEYNRASEMIKRLRNINIGSDVTWEKDLNENPKHAIMKDYLERNKIDTHNRRMVQNFLERKRQDYARVILNTIRNVEKEFSDHLGRPVKLEDIKPYGSGIEPPAQGESQ